MSEIEKMYEKVGLASHFCTYPRFCDDNNCNECPNYSSEFTAEKQIELIKWLGKLDGKLEITCTYNKEKFIFNFYFNRKTDKNHDPKYPYSNFLNEDIEILIASLINNLWQDLTEQERTEIAEILKG